MEYEVAKLEGARLNQAVAKAECVAAVVESYMTNPPKPAACWLKVHGQPDFNRGPYEPSTNWGAGGPIIERERIAVYFQHGVDVVNTYVDEWIAGYDLDLEATEQYESGGGYPYIEFRVSAGGPTPLIAAMRAYCASKFGKTVELP